MIYAVHKQFIRKKIRYIIKAKHNENTQKREPYQQENNAATKIT